jgi:hypothetical protein
MASVCLRAGSVFLHHLFREDFLAAVYIYFPSGYVITFVLFIENDISIQECDIPVTTEKGHCPSSRCSFCSIVFGHFFCCVYIVLGLRNSVLKRFLSLEGKSSLGILFLFCLTVPRRVMFFSNNVFAKRKEVKKLSVVTLYHCSKHN